MDMVIQEIAASLLENIASSTVQKTLERIFDDSKKREKEARDAVSKFLVSKQCESYYDSLDRVLTASNFIKRIFDSPLNPHIINEDRLFELMEALNIDEEDRREVNDTILSLISMIQEFFLLPGSPEEERNVYRLNELMSKANKTLQKVEEIENRLISISSPSVSCLEKRILIIRLKSYYNEAVSVSKEPYLSFDSTSGKLSPDYIKGYNQLVTDVNAIYPLVRMQAFSEETTPNYASHPKSKDACFNISSALDIISIIEDIVVN